MPLYMKIDGITGPVQNPTPFQGSFELETVHFSRRTNVVLNRKEAWLQVKELFVTMSSQSGSVDVYKLAGTGEPRAFTIWFVRATGATFLIVKLLEARIASYYRSDRAGSDRPLESLHLEFPKLAYQEFGPPVHK